MTPLKALLKYTRLDLTGPTEYEWLIGEAPFAPDIIYTYAVNLSQTFFEFEVIIPVCDINTTTPQYIPQGAASAFLFSILSS